MNKPILSVIITVFNKSNSLHNSFNSIRSSYSNLIEVICIDDGSTDLSKEVILTNYSELGVNYFRINNSGVSYARNYGAYIASSNYIYFLDADDGAILTSITSVFEAIKKDYDLIVGFGNRISLNGKSYLIKPYLNFEDLKRGKLRLLAGSFFIKKSFFFKVGAYDTSLKYSENSELAFRILHSQPRIFFLNSVVFNYNQLTLSGSKNLLNRLNSVSHITNKAKSYRITYNLYFANLYRVEAFLYFKLNNYRLAQKSLVRSINLNMYSLKSYFLFAKLIIKYCLSKILYTLK
jgi:glycosyltransferase involved in cell wall biosynthesis